MAKKIKLNDEDYPTTGHEWDGIREYDKPMPRWWLYTFYLCIVFSIGYVIAYPAIPLLKGATPGVLGFATRTEVAQHIAEVNAKNAEIEAKLLSTPLEDVAADPDLKRFATAGGGAVFRTYCAQCHGAGAQGAKGYPNLQDDDWLWGGDLAALETTIRHGIRHDAAGRRPANGRTRQSALGPGLLEADHQRRHRYERRCRGDVGGSVAGERL